MASICAELLLNGCELIYEGPMVLTEVLFHPHTSVFFGLPVKKKVFVFVLFPTFLIDMVLVYIDLIRNLPDSILPCPRKYRILTLVSSYCISIREIFFSRQLTFIITFLTESSAIILSLRSVLMTFQRFMGNDLMVT